jgi:hypothetical protein
MENTDQEPMEGDMLHLDVSSKERKKEFSECKEGEKIVFEVETTVTKNADGKLVAKVDSILEYEKMDAEDEGEYEEEAEDEEKVPKALAKAVKSRNEKTPPDSLPG